MPALELGAASDSTSGTECNVECGRRGATMDQPDDDLDELIRELNATPTGAVQIRGGTPGAPRQRR